MKDELKPVWEHSNFGAARITVSRIIGVWSDKIPLKYFGYYILYNL